MNPFLYFGLLLAILFFLSKTVTTSLGVLIHGVTKSRKLTIGILAFIFLPGTVVHEFAHATVAELLRVYVGRITLLPKVEGDSIQLGSVQIAQSDPFRRFLIGTAPLIVGIGLIFLTFGLFDKLSISGFWPSVALFYILFQIGNTMFSSKRDMEGALELCIALILVFGFLHLVGLDGFFKWIVTLANNLNELFKTASDLLIKIVLIDLLVICTAKILNWPIKLSK